MTLSPPKTGREAGTSSPARRATRRRPSASHLLIAIVVVLAFLLNLLALQDRDSATLVAVAAHPITAGSVLSKDMIRLTPIDADFEGLDSMIGEADLPSFDGWIASRAIPEDGVILVSSLVEPAHRLGLRTMSIPVEPSHASGGSIGEGDLVDVITVTDGVAAFVVTGLEVVAVSDPDTSSFAVSGAYHIVVAVNTAQALAVASAIDGDSFEIVRSTGVPEAEGGG